MDPRLCQEIKRSSRQFSRRRTQISIEDNWTAYNQSRARSRTPSTATMSTFKTNPYDKVLDLDKDSDLKLYKEAVKGLEKEDKFDGKKEHFDTVQKLMGKSFREVKCMEALLIPIERDSKNANDADMQLVLKEADIFETNKVSKEQVKRKSKLVWAGTTHGVSEYNNIHKYTYPKRPQQTSLFRSVGHYYSTDYEPNNA